ncbi:hypothetical protein M413DRAFT_28478 [Hebeloma cylindrosporum]|uniref:Uncharacterized protein n=1 Tax=Hebeloma cylindrosporum TaxID=76867 RepID=A0A0C2YI22_HEBCY|nr:hypothetical protein M413DRAFT_28478 [Hebeloma cylindrosporum h7]
MEPMNPRPPIANLPQEILWHIFSLEATPQLPRFLIRADKAVRLPRGFPDRLRTARLISQVCVSWRKLILDSPSIWGNLIDLEYLQQKSDAWRDEVLRRSGGAANLAICGRFTLTLSKKGLNGFLEKLLCDHWERIYWLDIECINAHRLDSAWDNLGRAAPKMRLFSVFFYPHSFSSPAYPLLSHHAPKLAHFYQNRLPIQKLEAFSISGLTSLTLDSISDLSIVLEICSRNHSLQTLSLFLATDPDDSISIATTGHLRRVDLPCLSSLKIGSELSPSMAFLDHVEPGPGCALELTAVHPDNTSTCGRLTQDEFLDVQRIIAKYATNYFSRCSDDTSLLVAIDQSRISLTALWSFEFSVGIIFHAPALRPLQASTFFRFLRKVVPVDITEAPGAFWL